MRFTALFTSVLLVLVLSDLPRPTLARRGGIYCGPKGRKSSRCNSNVNFIKRLLWDDKQGDETGTGATLETEGDREIEDEELFEKLRLLRDLLQELQLEEDERLVEVDRKKG